MVSSRKSVDILSGGNMLTIQSVAFAKNLCFLLLKYKLDQVAFITHTYARIAVLQLSIIRTRRLNTKFTFGRVTTNHKRRDLIQFIETDGVVVKELFEFGG